jgi:hypothetical protein
MYNKAEGKAQSLNRGCRDISGVVGPLAERAEVSDDGRIADHESSRRAGIGVAFPHAVYSSVQMLEKHLQNRHFRHFSARPAWLAGGKACSATRCSTMSSDTTCARPGHPKPSGYGCTETATPVSADCTLSRAAHHGTRPALVGVSAHSIPAPQVACPCVDLTGIRFCFFLSLAGLNVRGHDRRHPAFPG